MSTTGPGSGRPDEDGEPRRTRPEVFTLQAKAVLVVWLAVTLVLLVVYAIVLLLF